MANAGRRQTGQGRVINILMRGLFRKFASFFDHYINKSRPGPTGFDSIEQG